MQSHQRKKFNKISEIVVLISIAHFTISEILLNIEL